jgi:hypothetical protein
MPASTVTVAQICTAIDTTLGAALVASGDLTESQNFSELTEGMNDEKVLQIYPEEEAPVSVGSGTQKITFGSTPFIDEEIVIHADYYGRQRSHIGEDMATLVSGIDAIRANLKTQNCPNPFSLTGIANFQWSWNRVVFEYGGPELKYIGARFRLVFRTF